MKTSLMSRMRLDEQTIAQVLATAYPKHAKRVAEQGIRAKFLGINKGNILVFRVNSGTTPGKYYDVQLKFLDDYKFLRKKVRDQKEAEALISLMAKTDILFHDPDESFQYIFHYQARRQGVALRPLSPDKAPTRNAYGGNSTITKHIYAALRQLPSFYPAIAKEFIKQGIIKVEVGAPRLNFSQFKDLLR